MSSRPQNASRPPPHPATIGPSIELRTSSLEHLTQTRRRRNHVDFRPSAEEEAFRQEVRGFLKQELPANWGGADPYGADAEGSSVADLGRRITKKLVERKWIALAGPKEYGGMEATHMQQMIFNEEMAYHAVPAGGAMGVAWVGPSIMLYGTDEQKQRFLPRITSGEDIWCTLYSEPSAGSDLAALQTRAVRD